MSERERGREGEGEGERKETVFSKSRIQDTTEFHYNNIWLHFILLTNMHLCYKISLAQ